MSFVVNASLPLASEPATELSVETRNSQQYMSPLSPSAALDVENPFRLIKTLTTLYKAHPEATNVVRA